MAKTKRVSKKEIVRQIGKQTGFTQRDIMTVIDSFCEVVIANMLNDNKVVLKEFGIFTPSHLKKRRSRNPYANKEIIVPPKTVIKFKPSPIFVNRLNPQLNESYSTDDFDDED